MKLTYVGPHDAVDVPLFGPVAGVIHAVREGDPIDVPEDLGRSLLEQPSNWKLAGRQSKAADAAKEKE